MIPDWVSAAPSLRDAAGVELRAQAKINLRLRVLARERDGHHQLETLFLRLALADVVRVRRANGRSLDVRVSAPEFGSFDIGPVEQNLAWRAAVAYRKASGDDTGFAIELDKHIPVGAGLGGGSADAGAVLRALDASSARPLGTERLLHLAASLGADVPFMTVDAPYALGWGRGERLLALRPPPPREVLLLVPPSPVHTASAYGWLDETSEAQGQAALHPGVLDIATLGDWQHIVRIATNDFEAVVARRHPEIAALLEAAGAEQPLIAMLSGSGATVFVVVERDVAHTATRLAERIASDGGRVLRTKTAINVEHPSPME